MDLKNKKVALVHDFLLYPGGAEKVLEVLCEIFPKAPIYTLLYDKEKMRGKFADREIRTSFLQNFPKFLRKYYRWLLPLMPTAPETFDLREFDLVISSSGAWSKGIITRLNTIHIAYIHSPMRFAWEHDKFSIFNFQFSKFFVGMFLNYLRIWDRQAADRPDYLIANSKYTQDRIAKYYRKKSEVIYPPVSVIASEARQSRNNTVSDINNEIAAVVRGELPRNDRCFMVVSRLSPYKKIDAVVEAFNKLELPLVVIGEGKQEKYLRKIAGKNVKILGWQSNEKLEEYCANARAFVFPSVDDFGIAPVEAMSRGLPIVAIRQGGVMETVIEGETGEFFDAATPEVIADGVRRLMENEKNYDKRVIVERAEEFGKEIFIKKINEFIANIM